MGIEKPNNCNDLRMIVASLFYLSKEAEKSDMEQVSKIIQAAISRINDWTEGGDTQLSDILINEDTLNILSLLSRFSEFPLEKRDEVVEILMSADNEICLYEGEETVFVD